MISATFLLMATNPFGIHAAIWGRQCDWACRGLRGLVPDCAGDGGPIRLARGFDAGLLEVQDLRGALVGRRYHPVRLAIKSRDGDSKSFCDPVVAMGPSAPFKRRTGIA